MAGGGLPGEAVEYVEFVAQLELREPGRVLLGRRGAAGYLARCATELEARGLDSAAVQEAAAGMLRSSETFQALRYETDLARAGDLLTEIASHELAALDAMRSGWEIVRTL